MAASPSIIARFRADLRLALIAFFGLLSSLIVLPFGVYRLMQAHWVMAAVDFAMVAIVAAAFAHAWRTGRSLLVGNFIVPVITAIGVAATAVLGLSGVFWLYTVLVANFMLGSRPVAMAGNLAVIAAPLLLGIEFPSAEARLVYVLTALLVSTYAFLFAWMTEDQRNQLVVLASRDPLTHLPNRRLMETELAAAVAARGRRGGDTALAVLDIDHFKQINDAFGHDAGDRVLVAFAELVQGCVRKRDRLYRFGGEEFVLLLPATDADGARRALEKILERVRSRMIGPPAPVRASVGVAMLGADDDWPAWLARADAALYHAKRSGRDRVCMAHDLDTTLERRAPPEPA